MPRVTHLPSGDLNPICENPGHVKLLLHNETVMKNGHFICISLKTGETDLSICSLTDCFLFVMCLWYLLPILSVGIFPDYLRICISLSGINYVFNPSLTILKQQVTFIFQT